MENVFPACYFDILPATMRPTNGSGSAPKVLIFGGGVGGLSVAHELLERGFRVTVLERKHWGGKVRGIPVPGSGTDGRADLPGHHGFHFFPCFYQNLPDTMSRIPVGTDGKTVADHLVWGDFELLARAEEPSAKIPAHLAFTWQWLTESLKAVREMKRGIPWRELIFFGARALAFSATCRERRLTELDEVTWWDYVDACDMTEAYQHLVANLSTAALIAVEPEIASTRTLGDAMINMMESGFTPGKTIDRVLDGPEQETWVLPWVAHLQKLGGEMIMPASLRELEFDGRRITGAVVEIDGQVRREEADYYVVALPVDVASRFFTPDIRRAAPSLARIDEIEVGWMNGIQLFLRRELPIVRGHVGFDDTPWALTSVSQAQFWNGFDWSRTGDGTAREAFSVIISDWDTPGVLTNKPAKQCTAEEIYREVVAQLNASLDKIIGDRIEEADVLRWFLDPDIQFPRGEPLGDDSNQERLFVTTVGAWSARPGPKTEIPNMFLASDWLRTYMDFASAEGTNEVSRRCANAILDAAQSQAPRAWVGRPQQPWLLAPFRFVDKLLYRAGLPGIGYWGATPFTPPPRVR
jgi:15-cis-phytoene desaturase